MTRTAIINSKKTNNHQRYPKHPAKQNPVRSTERNAKNRWKFLRFLTKRSVSVGQHTSMTALGGPWKSRRALEYLQERYSKTRYPTTHTPWRKRRVKNDTWLYNGDGIAGREITSEQLKWRDWPVQSKRKEGQKMPKVTVIVQLQTLRISTVRIEAQRPHTWETSINLGASNLGVKQKTTRGRMTN